MTSRRISSDNRHAQKDKRYRHAQKDREKNCRKIQTGSGRTDRQQASRRPIGCSNQQPGSRILAFGLQWKAGRQVIEGRQADY